jgi:hypothetical protein
LIRSLFQPLDVTRILQIPLHHQGFNEFIAWGLTKHGKYTVRSGITVNGGVSLAPRLDSYPFVDLQPITQFEKFYGNWKFQVKSRYLYGEHCMVFCLWNVSSQIDILAHQASVLFVHKGHKTSFIFCSNVQRHMKYGST